MFRKLLTAIRQTALILVSIAGSLIGIVGVIAILATLLVCVGIALKIVVGLVVMGFKCLG